MTTVKDLTIEERQTLIKTTARVGCAELAKRIINGNALK